MSDLPTAYPLQWPAGWPRTAPAKRQDSKYRFRKSRFSSGQSPFWTLAEARDALLLELKRIAAQFPVLSTNYELRLDGLPRANRSAPNDTGVAIYFQLKNRPMVMACDMHVRAEENMRSLTLALQAMRQLERHGGGVMMEKAFDGFTALPPPSADNAPHWSDVLGVDRSASPDEIKRAFREKAKTAHPDHPDGSTDAMARLNRAREEVLGRNNG